MSSPFLKCIRRSVRFSNRGFASRHNRQYFHSLRVATSLPSPLTTPTTPALRSSHPHGRAVSHRMMSTLPAQFEVDESSFQHMVKSKQPVVLDCYAPWCEPCKTLRPMLVEACAKAGVSLAFLDVDKHPKIVNSLKVKNLPTVFAIKDGRLVDSFEGMRDAAQIQGFVGQLGGGETQPEDTGADPASKLTSAQTRPPN